MLVIPCIDIMDGECVQLIGGKPETATFYGPPEKWLEKWMRLGADTVHIIDLDAALGRGSNRDTIMRLLELGQVSFQIGGGIHTTEYAQELAESGALRVIIGSKAKDLDFMVRLNELLPKEKIMAALDIKAGRIMLDGWQSDSGTIFSEALEVLRPYIGSILTTNVDVEGRLGGPDKVFLGQNCSDDIPTYVSGGFTSLKDIELAKSMGFAGVIIGGALYSGILEPEGLW